MLDKTSKYEVLKLDSGRSALLLLHKSTETGSPFVVVAGYYLNEVGRFEESILAEIETISVSDYASVKELIRKTRKSDDKVPITFW